VEAPPQNRSRHANLHDVTILWQILPCSGRLVYLRIVPREVPRRWCRAVGMRTGAPTATTPGRVTLSTMCRLIQVENMEGSQGAILGRWSKGLLVVDYLISIPDGAVNRKCQLLCL